VRRWVVAVLLLLCAGLAGHASPGAAQPSPAAAYATTIVATDDAEIDAALKEGSLLLRLQDEPLTLPVALIGRARTDADRAATVLRALGYFDGQVGVTLDGVAHDDPSQATRLQQAEGIIAVVLKVTPGPRTVIGSVEVLDADGQPLAVRMPGPPAGTGLDLAPGAPARGADILAAENRVLAALRADGHAYARVLPRVLLRDPALRTLAVTFKFDPGPVVRIGRIQVEGLQTIRPAFVEARMAPRQGRTLTPQEIEAARRALLDLGVFAVVRARTAPAPGPDGSADLTLVAT